MKILNQKGITLIEVMMASGLMLVLALVMAKMTQTSNQAVKKVEMDTELQDLQNFVKANMSRGENCKVTFNETGGPGHMLEMDGSGASTKTDPANYPGGPGQAVYYGKNIAQRQALKFYEFSNLAGNKGTTFKMVTQSTAGNADSFIDFPAGGQAAGYPEWNMVSIRVYELIPTQSVDAGICFMRYEFERKQVATNKRSLGVNNKVFWRELYCQKNNASHFMEYCVDNNAMVEGYWKLKNAADPSEGIEYPGPGDVYIVNHLVVESDRKIKKDEREINFATEKLENIRGLYYFMRREDFPEKNLSDREQLGFFAQEVEKEFPMAVYTNPRTGLKSIRYSMLIPVLVEAHKEQEDKILRNEKRIQKLEKMLFELTN